MVKTFLFFSLMGGGGDEIAPNARSYLVTASFPSSFRNHSALKTILCSIILTQRITCTTTITGRYGYHLSLENCWPRKVVAG